MDDAFYDREREEATAAAPPEGSICYRLKKPVKMVYSANGKPDREETITHVTMRTEVTGADMLAADDRKGDIAKSFALIESLSDASFAALCKMGATDIEVLMNVAEGNAPAGLTTGDAS